MKNLPHSYKKWLTIKTAADILSHTLSEPVSVADILQLVIEDEFPIYLRTHYSPVQKVIPYHPNQHTDAISWTNPDVWETSEFENCPNIPVRKNVDDFHYLAPQKNLWVNLGSGRSPIA